MKKALIIGGTILFIVLATSIIIVSNTVKNTHVVKNPALDTSFSLKINASISIDDQKITDIDTIVTTKIVIRLIDASHPCFCHEHISLTIDIFVDRCYLGRYILNDSNLHKVSFMNYYVQLLDFECCTTEWNVTFVVKEYGPD